MLDPFSYWTRVLASWRTIGATGVRMFETADAATDVVASRTRTMADAATSPTTGDYAELARMLPEKMTAFSVSGNAVARACWNAQTAYIVEAQHIGAMMMRGHAPSAVDLANLWSRSSLAALHGLEATARLGRDALAPVHAAAVSNARRLRRSDRAASRSR